MSVALDDPPDTGYRQAHALLAAKGKTFYWASHLLGERHAQRATLLYRFCRYLDDLVDEASSPDYALAALESVRAGILSGHSTDAVVADALRLIKECGVNSQAVLELINGVESDLGTVRLADEADLLRYCYRVAGTVGIMMSAVLEVRNEAALPYAIDLGIAMQLTNICRDVAEDAGMGRRYLPASLVGDISPGELRLPTPQTAARAEQALARLLNLAETYYASGMAGLPFLPLGARSGIVVAGQIYRQIGVQLKSAGYNYLKARAVVSARAKAFVTARALVVYVCNPSFWRVSAAHDANLHLALRGLPCVHTAERPSHG